jgi:hypothetical protein
MATDADPVVGHWYRHLDKGQKFEVVAVDEDRGTVEVQHFDGDVEEIDIDTWYQQEIELIEPPENWSGPVDSFEDDALDYTETDMDEDDWEGPTSDFDEAPGGARKRRQGPKEEGSEEEAAPGEEQGFADDDLWREEEE